jgi:hypothetical protein
MLLMGRVASVYLTDYAQELKRVGEVVFRRRYSAPVLIVTGRAAELVGGPDRPSREVTMLSKPGGGDVKSLALMHRVFPIVKAPFSPRGPVLVGRTGDNDVAIPEYSISKRHCFFEFQPGEIAIFDCGSTNGTLLDGQKLEPKKGTRLKGGEIVTLGRYAFMFQPADGFLQYVRGLGEQGA